MLCSRYHVDSTHPQIPKTKPKTPNARGHVFGNRLYFDDAWGSSTAVLRRVVTVPSPSARGPDEKWVKSTAFDNWPERFATVSLKWSMPSPSFVRFVAGAATSQMQEKSMRLLKDIARLNSFLLTLLFSFSYFLSLTHTRIASNSFIQIRDRGPWNVY